MKREKNYGDRPAEESEFHLRIPEGPPPRPQGSFIELRGGGGGHHSYQQYAQYCLDEQGGDPGLEAFKAKFTAWSLEDTPNGIFLYPEGSAFKVLGAGFTEGDAGDTYHADAAHYTALMLCLHPTTLLPEVLPSEAHLASYEITVTYHFEPGGPIELPVQSQKPIDTSGEIVMLKQHYYPGKVSFRIKIFPSPHGRNDIYLGGRLGTILAESI